MQHGRNPHEFFATFYQVQGLRRLTGGIDGSSEPGWDHLAEDGVVCGRRVPRNCCAAEEEGGGVEGEGRGVPGDCSLKIIRKDVSRTAVWRISRSPD